MVIDLNVVIAGAAGEGVQTVGDVLSEITAAQGYAVFAWQEFESRIRGGQNSYSIRISEKPINAPRMKADILLALNEGALAKYSPLINEGGILIAPKPVAEKMVAIDFSEVAQKEFGNRIYANTVAIGALAAAVGIDLDNLNHVLAHKFEQKGNKVIDENVAAAAKGYALAGKGCKDVCRWQLPKRKARYKLIAGKEALVAASVLAGCRFMAAYPMSPSTDIITILAQHEKEFGVFTEQAEDEIAAVNMAIGAGFAGARAMTATSGGGFALMVESISLSGMTETPVVIILAQRPGPATGLPTRTAQGDLLFAVNAGHGEFAKMVIAPANVDDIFKKTIRAFDLADQYQIPVILLTDQFLMDSVFSVDEINPAGIHPTHYLADPAQITEYRRYQVTRNGISPRLYPGQSKHLVTADSDEHDEWGHITEDLSGTVVKMAEKRLAKIQGLKSAVNLPEEIDVDGADMILVGWGSSRQALMDGIKLLCSEGIRAGMIHFTELWPLPRYRFPEGKKYWVVENNATGQLAKLLRSEYGVIFAGAVTRYDGLPLTGSYVRRSLNG